ncbi:MAG: T9SS type A sorting domain-containing protein, partial [Bacteroidales bacterium]
IANPTVNTTYNVAVFDGSTTVNSQVVVTVNALLSVSVNVSASDTTICTGDYVTFTANPVNGGITPVFQWYINGTPVGSNSNIYSDASLSNNDVITCQLTSSESCASGNPATSDPLTITVYPLPPTPTITQNNDSLISSEVTGNQWYLTPDSLLAGATGQYYIPTSTGDYYVIVTDIQGCRSDISNIISFVSGLGSSYYSNNSCFIYPNPSNGYITIQFNYPVNDVAQLNVTNTLGESVLRMNITNQITVIDLRNFAGGIYFGKIKTSKGIDIIKITIEK